MSPMESRDDLAEAIYSIYREDSDYAEILPFFVDELPGECSVLRTFAGANDFESIRREAHKLRGSAGGYGFPGLSELAGRLEDSCKIQPQDGTSILRILDDLLDYLAKVRV